MCFSAKIYSDYVQLFNCDMTCLQKLHPSMVDISDNKANFQQQQQQHIGNSLSFVPPFKRFTAFVDLGVGYTVHKKMTLQCFGKEVREIQYDPKPTQRTWNSHVISWPMTS